MESDYIYHDSDDIDNYKQNKKTMDVRTINVAKVEFNRKYPVPGKSFAIYYFNLEDEDGFRAQFSSNAETQVKFLIGESYEVKVEVKQTSAGTYNFIDYSDAEKEKRKESAMGGGKAKAAWSPYQRPRPEAMLIIAQSSYEAAALLCVKVGETKIDSHESVMLVAKKLSEFVVDLAGFNSTECKNGIKDALKAANEKSIVYQKALKIAVELLDLRLMEKKLGEPGKLRNTQGIIALAEFIVQDIYTIANGL